MPYRFPHSPSRARRGTVMVLVIWIVLVLSVVAYSLAYEMRIGLKMTSQGQKRIQAQGLARVGLAHGVMDLRNDRLLALADSGRNTDTLGDVWANVEDKIDVKHGAGRYSVLIIDEERKLNVNVLTMGAHAVLSELLQDVAGMKDEVARTAACAMIDYKDPDLIPVNGQGDDEINFYTETAKKLMRRTVAPDWIFRPKNDQMLTMGELLEIPGITPEVLYGDPETAMADPFEAALEKRRKPSKALADYVTLTSEGALNINTCPVPLMEAIIVGITHNNEDRKWAEKVETIRRELLKKRGPEGYGISNVGQLVQEGIPANVVDALGRGIPLCTNSMVFTITSRGEYDGVRASVVATVSVGIEPYSLDQLNKRDRKRDPKAMGLLANQPNLAIDPTVRVLSMSEF